MPTNTTSQHTFTCRQVLGFFGKAKRMDRGSLPKEVKAHLKRCQSCSHHFTSLQATLTVFGTRFNVHTPQAIRRHIKEQLIGSTKK